MDSPLPCLSEWLERWIKTYAPLRCRSKATLERYASLSGYLMVTPELSTVSSMPIAQITRHDLQTGILSLIGWRARRREHLSARTIRHFGSLLHVALDRAVRLDLITRNPMDAVELPASSPHAARSLTSAEIARLRDVTRSDWTGAYIELALATGCRRGELLALAWSDLDGRVLTIARSLGETKAGTHLKCPKSGKVRRCTLPRIALDALARVKNQRPNHALIFPDEFGQYRRPSLVSQMIVRRLRLARIRDASLHTLRHTHASLLLSRGVPLPAVATRLGHADPAVTARLYSHALPPDDERAADEWDALWKIEYTEKTLNTGELCV